MIADGISRLLKLLLRTGDMHWRHGAYLGAINVI